MSAEVDAGAGEVGARSVAADYAECAVFRHAWERIPATRRPSFGVYLWARCTRCTTRREDIVDRFTGRLLARAYYYPEGYSYAKGERPSVDEFRRLLLAPKRSRKTS